MRWRASTGSPCSAMPIAPSDRPIRGPNRVPLSVSAARDALIPRVWPILLAPVAALLWTPLLVRQGLILTRDPSLYATASANISLSLGILSPQGGGSNLASQGLFYEPYAVASWILNSLGMGGPTVARVIYVALSLLGLCGFYRLALRLGAKPWAAALGSAVFLLNPWSLDQFGYFYTWTGYCLLPTILLATAGAMRQRRPTLLLVITLALSGGAVAWLINALASAITAWAFRPPTTPSSLARRRAGYKAVAASLALASAFWTVPYAGWVLFSSGGEAAGFSQVTGSVIQNPNPIVSLLSLRDFWWPHLQPQAVVSPDLSAVSMILTIALVAALVGWCSFLWPSNTRRSAHYLQRSLLTCLVVGAALALGTFGPTGWAYSALHSWPLAGGSLVRALLRDPANYAALFVLPIAAAFTLAVQGCRPRKWLLPVLLVAAAASVAPSLAAFQDQYTPARIPAYYTFTAHHIPAGLVLELGRWNDVLLSPTNGLAHYSWNQQLAADPTLLMSYIDRPSLSPALSGSNSLDSAILSASPRRLRSVLVTLRQRLHVRLILFQDDLVRRETQPWARTFQLVRADGLVVRGKRSLPYVTLAARARSTAWMSGCRVDDLSLPFSLFSVNCGSKGGPHQFTSSFALTGPLIGWGLNLGKPRHVIEGLGTQVRVAGRSGMVIALPGLLALIGSLITLGTLMTFLACSAMRATFSRVRTRARAFGTQRAARHAGI